MGHEAIRWRGCSGRTSHHEAATSGQPSLDHSLRRIPTENQVYLLYFVTVSQQSNKNSASPDVRVPYKTTNSAEIAEERLAKSSEYYHLMSATSRRSVAVSFWLFERVRTIIASLCGFDLFLGTFARETRRRSARQLHAPLAMAAHAELNLHDVELCSRSRLEDLLYPFVVIILIYFLDFRPVFLVSH